LFSGLEIIVVGGLEEEMFIGEEQEVVEE